MCLVSEPPGRVNQMTDRLRKGAPMEHQDRSRGLMVGLAVGNLLGIPCEGWPREEIRLRWPDGVRDIEAKAGYPDDDDLAQAVILAAACDGAEALDVDDLARRFWVWGEENGLGMGHATNMTLTRYGGSRPRRYGSRNISARRRRSALPDFQLAREPVGLPALEASRAAWEDSGGKAAGNGAVMRCAPLAIRWRRDDVALVRNTVCSAAVTHWDSRCIWSSVFVNLAIASLLREPPDNALRLVERAERARETLGDALAPFGVDAPPRAAVTKALDVADVTAPEEIGLDGWDMGYTLKAMQVALWCARQAADFEEALITVVNAGGDTDTNGAVAGAVLGVRFGFDAIPRRWRDQVAKLRADRVTMEVWSDRLMETRTSPRSAEGAGEMTKENRDSSRLIRVSGAVWNAIAERGKFGETEDDVLRRVFGLLPQLDPEQPVSGKRGTGRRAPRRATKRMSVYVERSRLFVQFADDEKSWWDLPDPTDKRAIRRIRDEAVAFALAHGATDPGQTNAVKKALTDAGYHLTR